MGVDQGGGVDSHHSTCLAGPVNTANSPLLNISKTKIVVACVYCIIEKDSWSIDMFPLIKVEIIVAIFIVAVKFVLPKSRKSQLPRTRDFSVALRG
jgi:hypothetical protein